MRTEPRNGGGLMHLCGVGSNMRIPIVALVLFASETAVHASPVDLRVETRQVEGPVEASTTFVPGPGTGLVKVRYRFATEEVPGGFCGSEYNDGFSVSILVEGRPVTNFTSSMNELGCNAFNASGQSAWRELAAEVPSDGSARVKIVARVSNIRDEFYQSAVVIDQVTEQTFGIPSVKLFDIDDRDLDYLSARRHTLFSGQTPIHGTITLTGSTGDSVADVFVDALAGTTVVATARLSAGGREQLLKAFPVAGVISVSQSVRLFDFPTSGAGALIDGEAKLRLRVTAVATSGQRAVFEGSTSRRPFARYLETNRYGGRDEGEGGDDWARPDVISCITALSSEDSTLTWDDFSNMHGGVFNGHPAGAHDKGREIDGFFAGYYEVVGAGSARKKVLPASTGTHLVALARQLDACGIRLRSILATYAVADTDPLYAAIKDLKVGGRDATSIIVPWAGHDGHFHVKFEE